MQGTCPHGAELRVAEESVQRDEVGGTANVLTDIHKCNIKKSIFPSGNLFPDFHRVHSIYHAGKSVPRFSNVN